MTPEMVIDEVKKLDAAQLLQIELLAHTLRLGKSKPRKKSDAFPYAGIDMSGYTFDREEANER